jgi:magnesium chelatase subunit I
MLGERGQAKTRLIRQMVELLDERIPVIVGCEVNDHPYRPICAACRALVAEQGDDTAIRWIDRDDRYAEKLATPDTSVADLIGDVDPIRVAEGRYLADELTIHYGMIPRTNRGIVAINELPDLPERIQVALFNILGGARRADPRLPDPAPARPACSSPPRTPDDYTHRGPDRLAAEGPVRARRCARTTRSRSRTRSRSWSRRRAVGERRPAARARLPRGDPRGVHRPSSGARPT